MKQQVAPLQANEVANIRKRTAAFDVRQHEFREEFRKMKPMMYSCKDAYDLLDQVKLSISSTNHHAVFTQPGRIFCVFVPALYIISIDLPSFLRSYHLERITRPYQGVQHIAYRRALSGGWCRGSSATSFQLILITDCQPHPTVYRRWPNFSGRRCSRLEQSAWSCHLRTFRSCLPVPAQNPPV